MTGFNDAAKSSCGANKPKYVVRICVFIFCPCFLGRIPRVISNTHRRRNSTVELLRVGVGGVYMNSRLAHNGETDRFGQQFENCLTMWILIGIDNLFNNDVIVSSLVTRLSGSTVQLGHDCRRVRSCRRYNATQLRCQEICSNWSTLSPTRPSCKFRTHCRRYSTRQLSVVGGVY